MAITRRGPYGGGNKSAGGHDRPPTPDDLKMSIAHARDSIKFNMRHAKDHMKAAQKAKSRLTMVRKARVRAI
jgi:hypothetical protein